MRPKEDDILDDVKQELYSHEEGEAPVRHDLEPSVAEASEDWEYQPVPTEKEAIQKQREVTTRKFSFGALFLIVSGALFLIALALFTLRFVIGVGSVSPEKISVNVEGPRTVRSGELSEFQITLRNRNTATLQNAVLVVDFPPGALNEAGERIGAAESRRELGQLASGQKVSETFSAKIFGKENVELPISIRLEYTIGGSSTTFFKDATYPVVVSSAPVTLLVRPSAKEVSSGRQFEIQIEVSSNSATTIKDVAVGAELPFGYVLKNATPKPEDGQNVWLIGDLEPQDRKTITLVGLMEGQNNEKRVFTFSGGVYNQATSSIEDTFALVEEELYIREPLLTVALNVGGAAGGEAAVIQPGDTVSVSLPWKNNYDDRITNLEIVVPLDSDLIDLDTVQTTDGFYRSNDNRVVFDRTTSPSLAEALPGESGQVSFSFVVVGAAELKGAVNPQLTLNAKITGSEPVGFQTKRLVENTASRLIRFGDGFAMQQRLTYSAGPFSNVGPLPPTPGQETSFSVTWSVTTGTNAISGARVEAELPTYMSFVDRVSPAGENVTYSEISKRVVWEIGDIPENTGLNASARSVSFQVVFSPSTSQSGTSPTLLRTGNLTGYNTFTKNSVSVSNQSLQLNALVDGPAGGGIVK